MRKHSFLQQVAKDLKLRYGDNIRHLEVVFPSRRSGRLFQRHLSAELTQPIWSPGISTIEDFFVAQSQMTLADSLTQLNMLHRIWVETTEENEPFEQFYFFGKMLLSDFDVADKYLVSIERLYGHLKEIREVEAAFSLDIEDSEALKRLVEYFSKNWDSKSPASEFLKVWSQLANVYRKLNEQLRQKGLAYGGMIYRHVADHLHTIDLAPQTKFVFVGFNRINRCEDRLFTFLKNKDRADFYWNEDPHILHNLEREAGRFLKVNLKNFPPAARTSTDLKSDSKEINIAPLPFRSLQVQAVVDLMNTREKSLGDTGKEIGVILNDESLLLPLLWACPENGPEINVSAGLSLEKTPAYDLMRDVIALHEDGERTNGKFHYRNIEKVFRNPYLQNCIDLWMEAVKKMENGVWKDRRENVFFSLGEIKKLVDHPLVDILFQAGIQDSKLIESILKAMEYLYGEGQNGSNIDQEELITLKQEILRHGHKMLVKLRDILAQWPDSVSPVLLKNILRDIAQSRRIPFKGEPLQGIQLMGALESRNVSYDHLILPSMNEGVQPSVPPQSFIPYSLKRFFGLPVIEDEMADQSYYFWTLIAGASTVDILYDNSSSGMKKNEKSRFVRQIQFGNFPNWTYSGESILKMPLENNVAEKIEIERSREIQNQLLVQLQTRGLSPSSLMDFFSCELRFYFKFVLGADEDMDIPEEVDSRLLGNILHKTMELLYEKYKEAVVDADAISEMKERCPEVLRETLLNTRKLKGKFIPGHDIIAEQFLLKTIHRILDFDAERLPFTMKEHERKINQTIQVNGQTIKFGGIVDRIQKEEGIYRVIDYKTGKADPVIRSKEFGLPIPGNDQEKGSKINKAAIQLFIYTWLLEGQDEFKGAILVPELYVTRSLNKGFNPTLSHRTNSKEPIELDNQSEFYRHFAEQLEHSLKMLINPNRPFRQTTDENVCVYCPFKNICMR